MTRLEVVWDVREGGAHSYSSVAFISGHVCGEQNSVIEP